MFTFPVTAASDFVRNNIEAQMSLTRKMVGSMMDTSMQLGKLNIQASRKMMEESTAAAGKALELRSFADTQAFLVEQSQLAFQRFSGYSQNAQKIATGTMAGLTAVAAETNVQQEAPPEDASAKEKHAAPHGQQHEVDQQPSALVEKLISNVAGDTNNLH